MTCAHMFIRSYVHVFICSGLLAAAVAAPATALAAPVKLAIVPLRDSVQGAGDAEQLEKALVEAARQMPAVQLVNASGGALTGPKNAPLEARADPRVAARAQALGKETGAARVLAVEIARLGDGRVLYLQVIETASGKAVGSTTAALGGESREVNAEGRTVIRGALTRLLDPARHVGRLALKLDVPGAEVQIDGHKLKHAGAPIELSVGTHALRVTHPAYRDFLRFVDVEFDKTLRLDVNLAMYPLAEGEMTERLQKKLPPPKKVPWWRSWWALTISGVVLTGATVGITFAARPGIEADRTIIYKPTPAP